MSYRILSDAEVEHFVEFGYLVLRGCFPAAVVEEWAGRAFERLGCDRNDPATWKVERTHMPSMLEVEVEQFAPKLWGAICDLLGGAERIQRTRMWDSFIVNFCEGADRPWEEPSPKVRGWHKDGDNFRHFLDSPEHALQVLTVWTDTGPRGGGTFLATDSVPVVARYLAERPGGLLPHEFDFRQLIGQCREFVELRSAAGDVVLVHPFVLHTASQNHLKAPRVITNTPVQLKEPMNFDREDPGDFSLVERAVLRALGVARFEFRPAAARESFVAARIQQQDKIREEEKARLLARGGQR